MGWRRFLKATEGFLERNGILFYWIITMQTYWTPLKKCWVWRVWSQPKSSPAQATGRASTYRSWRLSKKWIFCSLQKKLTAESRVKEADFKAAPFPSTFSRYRMLHGWSTINNDTTEEGDGMGPYHYGDHGVHGGGGHETNGFSVGDTLQNKTNKGYIQETSGRLRYVEVCVVVESIQIETFKRMPLPLLSWQKCRIWGLQLWERRLWWLWPGTERWSQKFFRTSIFKGVSSVKHLFLPGM